MGPSEGKHLEIDAVSLNKLGVIPGGLPPETKF